MSDNKYKKILEKSYQDLAADVVAGIMATDDQPKAFQFLRILEKAVEAIPQELKEDAQLADFYQDLIIKLEFIALPSLNDKEILTLLKNNFCYQFKLDGYDLKRKIRIKLLSILLIEDRNKLKEEFKKILLENNEEITKNFEIKIVKDWVKNYTSKIGLDSKDKLARAQYMTGLKSNKNISAAEYENLKVLFDFFDILNTASDTPDGLEEEYPMMVNGKLHIFRKGVLEPVHESKAVEEALKNYSPDEKIDSINEDVSRDVLSEQPSQKILSVSTPEKPKTISRTTELEEILDSYSPSSLEYKAISQEIMRLKKTEARKNAKR
ncbi:MAG: hypothetical protein HY931_02675 [Candidatus Falkowbacteria bacterium]|nr:MAG: hypothetical protein HY931_02675 [Candidatus Falkowbacteria bacterium]